MNNLAKHQGAGPNAATSVASAQGRPWARAPNLIFRAVASGKAGGARPPIEISAPPI